MRRAASIAVLASVALGGGCSGGSADDVRMLGRYVELDDGRFEMGWPGSGMEFAFTGAAIDLPIEDGGLGFFDVRVDGQDSILTPGKGRRLYRIEDPDGDGKAVVRVTRRSESYDTGTFIIERPQGVDGSKVVEPPDRALNMLFVGDSITAGFGVAGDTADCPNAPRLHSPTQSYAMLAADQLGATPSLVAISGRGVVHNWDANPQPVMPEQLDFALPDRPDTRWDAAQVTPDVIVTLLGTNDWSVIDPGRDRFRAGYRDMLEKLRGLYPAAHIVTVGGPLLGGEKGAAIRDGIDWAMAELDDPKISTLDMQLVEHGLKWSCNSHPGRDSMAFMANALADHVAAQLGLPNPEPYVRTPASGWDRYAEHFATRVADIRALPDTQDATLLLGDSITEAWQWQDVQLGERILNHGVGGDTTVGLLNRWPLMEDVDPARILIMIGTNDLSSRMEEDVIVANTGNLIDRLMRAHPEVPITLQAVLPRETAMRGRVDSLNARYARLASAKGIDWIDMSEAFSDSDGKLRSALTEDDLHLNAAGYQLWAEQLRIHDSKRDG